MSRRARLQCNLAPDYELGSSYTRGYLAAVSLWGPPKRAISASSAPFFCFFGHHQLHLIRPSKDPPSPQPPSRARACRGPPLITFWLRVAPRKPVSAFVFSPLTRTLSHFCLSRVLYPLSSSISLSRIAASNTYEYSRSTRQRDLHQSPR